MFISDPLAHRYKLSICQLKIWFSKEKVIPHSRGWIAFLVTSHVVPVLGNQTRISIPQIVLCIDWEFRHLEDIWMERVIQMHQSRLMDIDTHYQYQLSSDYTRRLVKTIPFPRVGFTMENFQTQMISYILKNFIRKILAKDLFLTTHSLWHQILNILYCSYPRK